MPLTMSEIPNSFGKGGANIGDGDPVLAAILQQVRADLVALFAAAAAGTLAADGLSADAAGRAVIAAGYFDAATVAAKFVAGAIPMSKLAAVAAPATLSGPGAIDPTKGQTNFTSTAAGNALTLADGTYAGQKVVVFHSVKGASGTGVITPAHFDHTSVTLTDAYASAEFIWTGAAWTLGRLVGTATVTG
jgi:hypothetical protein